MCSSTVSDAANMSRHGSTLCSPTIEKNPLPFPISKRSHDGNLRQTRKQRETGVKRVETVGVYPLAPPRGAANPRAPQSATPRLISSGKGAAQKGRTRLRQFEYPAKPVLKKLPPGQNVALRASYAPESRRFLKTKRKTTHFREWFSWWKLTGSNR